MSVLTTVAQGDASRIVEPRRIVVRTAEEWSKLWELHAGLDSRPPSVNFAERDRGGGVCRRASDGRPPNRHPG